LEDVKRPGRTLFLLPARRHAAGRFGAAMAFRIEMAGSAA
jgi:hypothetical protein